MATKRQQEERREHQPFQSAPLLLSPVPSAETKEIPPFDYTGDSPVRTGLVLKQDLRQCNPAHLEELRLPSALRLFQGASLHIVFNRNGDHAQHLSEHTDVSFVHRALALKPENGEPRCLLPTEVKPGQHAEERACSSQFYSATLKLRLQRDRVQLLCLLITRMFRSRSAVLP